jgi:hypothetical protein
MAVQSPLRLRETPYNPADATVLHPLSFACATESCGLLIVPLGSASRITVRGDLDAVWAQRVVKQNVVRSPRSSLWAAKEAENKPEFAKPRHGRRLRCAGCGADVGRQHEVDGVVVSADQEAERPYKLTYCMKGRLTLQLVDAAKWAAIEPGIPPAAPRDPHGKSYAEMAADIAAAQAALGLRVPDDVHTATAAKPMLSSAVATRVLRAHESSAAGLHCRDSLSLATPAQHVEHGSSRASSWISATRNSNVALLWALPRGDAVTISIAAATALGSPAVQTLPATASGVAVARLQRDSEILFPKQVAPAAVERIKFRLVGADRRRCTATAAFPAHIDELTALVVLKSPDGFKTDWNCTLVAARDGRKFVWIPGAPNATRRWRRRRRRRALPPRSLHEWVAVLKRQLEAVFAACSGGRLPLTTGLALYDLEYEVWQERHMGPPLDKYVRTCALLLEVPTDDEAVLLPLLRKIHIVKKRRR